MKKGFLFIITLLLGLMPMAIFAQENTESLDLACNDKFEIQGPTELIKGNLGEYNINVNSGDINLDEAIISFALYSEGTLVNKTTTKNYFNNFEESGNYNLDLYIKVGDCEYITGIPIEVFDKSILFFGSVEDNIDQYMGNFLEKNILFEKVTLSENSIRDNDNISNIKQNKHILENTDILVVKSDNIDQVFQSLISVANEEKINMANKSVIVISDINSNLTKRMISKYISSFDEQGLYTLQEEQFLSLISELSFDNNIFENQYINLTDISLEETSKIFFVSYLSDILIYNGFPISLISVLLATAVAMLAITLFRQVIGFDVFGSYSPLMVGLSFVFIGWKLGLLLFLIALISTLLVRLFTKKFYLLYSAKIALLVCMYFVLTIVIFGLLYTWGIEIFGIDMFSNALIIFPMIFLLISSEKVFYEGFNIKKKQRWLSVLEFSIVSFIVYIIINSSYIRNIMLSYPELILFVVVLIIAVGRFTGLQLTEYFKFMPLFKSQDEEEE